MPFDMQIQAPSSVSWLTNYARIELKSQHVTSIAWLAKATGADVVGLEVGSKTLEFRPTRGPGDLLERRIKIRAESPAASSLLVLQAVLPFLVFAGNDSNEPIKLEISGGTNVSFSLSYEYWSSSKRWLKDGPAFLEAML